MDWLVGNNGRSTTLKICQERNEHILITNISLTWHLHWIGVAFKALTQGVKIQLRFTQCHCNGNNTIRQIVYAFLSAFHSNYGPNLYHFQDKASTLNLYTNNGIRLNTTGGIVAHPHEDNLHDMHRCYTAERSCDALFVSSQLQQCTWSAVFYQCYLGFRFTTENN